MRWRFVIAMVSGVQLVAASASVAQTAGSTTIGVAVAEMKEVVSGWSAKKDILGKPVYNEKNEKVGSVDDVIISTNNVASYAIVGTGGFVGLRKHDVAIPVAQLKKDNGKLILAGATKETLKSLPPFEYARK
jgi:sporulation protein YlmC with PRC-barrel domain